MPACLILGDSIAVGTKAAAPTECVAYAREGISSKQWNLENLHRRLDGATVIISLGSNDSGSTTYQELYRLRVKIRAQRVVWILPASGYSAQEAIRRIAREHNDVILAIPAMSGDGVHPSWRGYREIVRESLGK